MIEGVHRVIDLGGQLFIIYGASPLYEFEGLPKFIDAIESRGCYSTVIVDGVLPETQQRLSTLYDHGLRSITVSYDTEAAADVSTLSKSRKGLGLARWFRDTFKGLRDVMLVMTLTRKNRRQVMSELPALLAEGFWVCIDLVHPDRGQPGSRCKGDGEGLVFRSAHVEELREFARSVLVGDTSRVLPVRQWWEVMGRFPREMTSFAWKCCDMTSFPSWLVLDCDGTVIPCNDFVPPGEMLKVWELSEQNLREWEERNIAAVRQRCPGCAWGHYWEGVGVKAGLFSVDRYEHRSV